MGTTLLCARWLLTCLPPQGAVNFCQYFARGVCSNGGECPFFHLVPSAEDCARHEKGPTCDIFGRDRFAEEKSNMGGVGSFFSFSRTLYVAYGAASESLGAGLQTAFERVFSEWGPLEEVSVIKGKSIAFVRFVFRASAEFAKEAMTNQSLQPGWWPKPAGSALPEVLNVRWAYDDPNPVALRRNKREREEAYADAARRAEERLAPEQREALAQQRQLEGALAEAPRGAASLCAYPQTDGQYEGVGGEAERDAAWDRWAQQALEAGVPPQQLRAHFQAMVGGQQLPLVAAADAHEYDADDPSYYQEEEQPQAQAEQAPPAKRQALAQPPADTAAPLALLASYGSDDE